MTLRLHNTRTQQVEVFEPLNSEKVTLYTCGPTVYDYLHVGNWTAYIYWDTLVRTLIASGYRVERVMNITDVGHLVSDADEGEDKLEKGARREGKTAWEIAEFYAEDFVAGMEKLGLLPPEHLVKATEFIDQQLDLVRILKDKGVTYQTTDGIYFDTAKFPSYAEFAHLDLAAQKAGARVEQNTQKRQPWDFALWKFTPAGENRDMQWPTPDDLFELPTGSAEIMGFPGWHLECSAMAMSILGPTIDIHTGGIDHIPVHHTNEIAQSEAASGQRFATVWLHNNHLKIDGTKVSKSLGNTYTLQQLQENGYSAMDLRLFVLQGQFQNEGNFTFDNLASAKNRLEKWRSYAVLRHQTHDRLDDDNQKNDSERGSISLLAASGALREALQDNLNTPEALRVIDQAFSSLDSCRLDDIYHHGLIEFIRAIDELLGLQLEQSTPDIDDDAKRLIIERQRARDAKDWQASDRLRDQLAKKKILINDTPHGSRWQWA
ncbi:MAG: cysteine--tRNA ligase [Candidatus Saccharimonas aalborgensis]